MDKKAGVSIDMSVELVRKHTAERVYSDLVRLADMALVLGCNARSLTTDEVRSITGAICRGYGFAYSELVLLRKRRNG